MLFFALMVTVVAGLVLAIAANMLKPYQERNIKLEKMAYILKAAGYEGADFEQAFEKYVMAYAVNEKGEIVLNGEKDPEVRDRILKINLLKELKKKPGQRLLPVFEYHNGKKKLYILAMAGKGLWGPIWGYVALEDDLNTIAGVIFDHKSETPGLGAEITQPWFQKQFVGKKIFDEKGQLIGIRVVKGGAPKGHPHQVDGISGATLTGNGVSAMFVESLKLYLPYIQHVKGQATAMATALHILKKAS